MAIGERRDKAIVGVDGAAAAAASEAAGAGAASKRVFTGVEGGWSVICCLETGDTGGRLVSILLVQIRQ